MPLHTQQWVMIFVVFFRAARFFDFSRSVLDERERGGEEKQRHNAKDKEQRGRRQHWGFFGIGLEFHFFRVSLGLPAGWLEALLVQAASHDDCRTVALKERAQRNVVQANTADGE